MSKRRPFTVSERGSFLTACALLLAAWFAGRPEATAHETITHQTLMDFAVTNAGLLPTPLVFTSLQSTRMREGAWDEDNGCFLSAA